MPPKEVHSLVPYCLTNVGNPTELKISYAATDLFLNTKGEEKMPPKNDTRANLFDIIKMSGDVKVTSTFQLSVKSIKYSGKYTTVTWNDGTKTRVSCGENEQQSRYSAFCSALAIKVFGTNSQVKKLVETKDEQIEIDKQNRLRAEQERIAKIRKARKDRLWVKKRAKELVLEQRANEMAKNLLGE